MNISWKWDMHQVAEVHGLFCDDGLAAIPLALF
jgi:hypothetical protein